MIENKFEIILDNNIYEDVIVDLVNYLMRIENLEFSDLDTLCFNYIDYLLTTEDLDDPYYFNEEMKELIFSYFDQFVVLLCKKYIEKKNIKLTKEQILNYIDQCYKEMKLLKI